MSEPTDSELLDAMAHHGISLEFARQPDMGNRNWSARAGGIRVKGRFRTPREAINAALSITKGAQ